MMILHKPYSLLLLSFLCVQSFTCYAVVEIESNEGKYEIYKESYALLIGLSDYVNGNAWDQLPSIKKEINEVSDVLIKQGFKVEVTKHKLTSTELDKSIKSFLSRKYKRDTRLLIYFSGHGYTDNNLGYIVASNAPPENDKRFKQYLTSMNDIRSWSYRTRAKHVLFVFDSCFSGSVFKTRTQKKPSERFLSDVDSLGRQYITSGSETEEVPSESDFTPAFINGIQGDADMNEDNIITASELGQWLRNEIIPLDKQTPQWGSDLTIKYQKGDFIFVPNIEPWKQTTYENFKNDIIQPYFIEHRHSIDLWNADNYAVDIDGSAYVAGSIIGYGEGPWLAKYNSSGQIIWYRQISSDPNLQESPDFILIDPATNNILIGGNTYDYEIKDYKGWLMIISPGGERLNIKYFKQYIISAVTSTHKSVNLNTPDKYLLIGSKRTNNNSRLTGWFAFTDDSLKFKNESLMPVDIKNDIYDNQQITDSAFTNGFIDKNGDIYLLECCTKDSSYALVKSINYGESWFHIDLAEIDNDSKQLKRDIIENVKLISVNDYIYLHKYYKSPLVDDKNVLYNPTISRINKHTFEEELVFENISNSHVLKVEVAPSHDGSESVNIVLANGIYEKDHDRIFLSTGTLQINVINAQNGTTKHMGSIKFPEWEKDTSFDGNYVFAEIIGVDFSTDRTLVGALHIIGPENTFVAIMLFQSKLLKNTTLAIEEQINKQIYSKSETVSDAP
ncbi:MAG: caspase family protein [Candidatus Thiodiazotropha endolucinida]